MLGDSKEVEGAAPTLWTSGEGSQWVRVHTELLEAQGPWSRDDPGIEPTSLGSPALAGGLSTISITWEAQ